MWTDVQAQEINLRTAESPELHVVTVLIMCAFKARNCSDEDEDCGGTANVRPHAIRLRL